MANLNNFQEQLDILSATKTSIKEAIIGKGQEVSSEDSFSSYANKIDGIVTLDEGTADANANADDILLDKTAYVNGQKVTGTLEIADAVSIDNSNNTDTHLTLTNVNNIPSVVVGADINDLYGVKKVVEDGVGLEIIAPQSQFADVIGLTTGKIKAGETILGVIGKSTIVDTEDANATSNDIVINKTAYVNGEKITGILSETKDSQFSGPSITQEEIMRDGVSNIDDTNGFIGFRTINPGRFITDNNIIRVTVDKQVITTKYGIVSDKIKQGETILGITGNVIELNGETKTITPTTSQQVITPSQDKNAITEVTVNAVTSAIDSNIQAENIKNGVTILGITGTAQTIKTYATQQDMEQALNDGEIESGDFVLCEDIYNFYIAETNAETGDTDLIRLIRENMKQ